MSFAAFVIWFVALFSAVTGLDFDTEDLSELREAYDAEFEDEELRFDDESEDEVGIERDTWEPVILNISNGV